MRLGTTRLRVKHLESRNRRLRAGCFDLWVKLAAAEDEARTLHAQLAGVGDIDAIMHK